MDVKKKSSLIFLFFEALGFSCLCKIYVGITWPIFQSSYGFWKNMLFWLLYAVAGAVIAYGIRRINSGWSWKELGFRLHRNWIQDIWFGIVAFCVYYVLQLPVLFIILPTHSAMFDDSPLINHPSLIFALLLITGKLFTTGFFTGALHEEIRFRGYLQGMFTRHSWPAVGLFVSLIPFSTGHFFSHPEWNLLQSYNTILPGFIFCLSYYATGSLIVPITVHALTNLVPLYAPFMHARGNINVAYGIIVVSEIIAVLLIIKGKEEFTHLLKKTKELFALSGWAMSFLGLFLGVSYLALSRELTLLRSQLRLTNISYYIVLAGIALLFFSVSAMRLRKEHYEA